MFIIAVLPIIVCAAQEEIPFKEILHKFAVPVFKDGRPIMQEQHAYIINHFGNKTFNLCVLRALAPMIKKELLANTNTDIVVPPFIAVSSQTIARILKEIKIDEHWAEFVQKQGNNRELTPAAAEIVGVIRQQISTLFNDNPITPVIEKEISAFIQGYNGLLMVRSTGQEDRIDIANAGGNESIAAVQPNLAAIWQAISLVVQSYFSEKSLKQRLLAGDNITQKFFIPVLIQQMIGETLDTDKNPASRSAIPVSGVLFTQEAEGGTPGVVQIQAAYGHNQGVVNSLIAVDTFYIGPSGIIHPVIRKKTERLAPLKMAGTFKLEFMPNYLQEGNKKNYAMQKAPSLSAADVYALGQVARFIEKTYQTAMDCEFVVTHEGATAIINLVQARPIVARTYSQPPSFVSDSYLSSLKPNEYVTGTPLGNAGGFVRTIQSEQQIVTRDTLPQALNTYHENPQRNEIQGCIIHQMAPSTSHEATQFRSYAVPVVVTKAESESTINNWLQMGIPFLLDTQRGMLMILKGEEKERKSVMQPGWYTHPIPMQQSLLPHYALTKNAPITQQISKYARELAWISGDTDNLADSYRSLLDTLKKSTDRKEVVSILKRILHRLMVLAQQKKVEKLLMPQKTTHTVLLEFYLTLDKRATKGLTAEAHTILGNAILCASEILYTIDLLAKTGKESSTSRLQLLYPIKFLEATLLQQADAAVVDDYSYLQLRALYKQELEAIEKLAAVLPEKGTLIAAKTVEYLVQLEKMDKLALNTQISEEWQTFIQRLAQETTAGTQKERVRNAVIVKKFASITAQLKDLDVLDLWINTSFSKATQQGKNATQTALVLINELVDEKETKEGGTSTRQIVDWIDKRKNRIEAWRKKVDEWGDPEVQKFKKLYEQFQNSIIDECIIGTEPSAHKAYQALMYTADHQITPLNYEHLIMFIQEHAPLMKMFNKTNNIGKLMLLRFLHELIALFDNTIKGLTGSPLYEDKNLQAQRFAQLLIPYLALMEQMITLVQDQEDTLMLGGKAWGGWTLKKYLEQIRKVFAVFYNEAGANLLKASRSFSVGAAQIGSKVDFNRAQPHTLEDIFTLAHQNMLTVLSVLNKQFGITQSMLPHLVQKISKAIEQIKIHEGGVAEEVFKSNLIGIDYQFPNIAVYYNVPLRQHSSTFAIQYNVNKPDRAILECRYFGHNEMNRMNGIMAYAHLASLASGIEFAKLPTSTVQGSSEKAVSAATEFSWIITDKTNLNAITEYLQMFGEATLNFDNRISTMFRAIDAIKKIFNPKWRDFFAKHESSSDRTFAQLSLEERRDMLLNGLPQLPTSFFCHDLFFNYWFINQFDTAKMYDRVLSIIKCSLEKMIKESRYTYETNAIGGYLFERCIIELEKLLEYSELRTQIISFAKDVIFAPNVLKTKFENLEWSQKEPLINFAFALYRTEPNKITAEILESTLNSKVFALQILKTPDFIKQTEEIFEGKPYLKQFWTQLSQNSIKMVKNELEKGDYGYVANLVNTLIEYGTKISSNYSEALEIALALCKSTKVWKSYQNPATKKYFFGGINMPGAQYYFAAEIAQSLIKAGQGKMADEIKNALLAIQEEISKGSSATQVEEMKFVVAGLDLIQKATRGSGV